MKWLIWIVATYAVFWTALYMSMMGTDFSYAVQYFRWGLTGGERPVYINMTAILATLIVWTVVGLVAALRRRSK